MTNPDTDLNGSDSNTNAEQRGRRRFLGAGVAAAPFILTLASQPALGGIVPCFTPSRSLSRNTSLSQQGKYGECTGAASPSTYFSAINTEGVWPASAPPSTLFHPLFEEGGTDGVTKFVNSDGTSKTFGEVLTVSTTSVAAYLLSAYLNELGGNGAIIADNVITQSDILGMWFEYTVDGDFEPMAGIKWDASKIILYLTSNGIVSVSS